MNVPGIYRISAASPSVALANPIENSARMTALYEDACKLNAGVLLFPELSLTGATCGDLFFQDALIEESLNALRRLKDVTAGKSTAVIVGFPVRRGHRLFNCAAVIAGGSILGVTAKTLPDNDGRCFHGAGPEDCGNWDFDGENIPFGTDIVYDCGGFSFAVEFAADLSSPLPPSSRAVLNGAQVILCMGARPFSLQNVNALEQAVVQRSAALCAAYVYVNAGKGESTSAAAYSGGAIMAENGELRNISAPFAPIPECAVMDFIPRWLMQLRRRNPAFAVNVSAASSRVRLPAAPQVTDDAAPALAEFPFVPEDAAERSILCDSILDTQAEALAQRVRCCNAQRLVLGVSGGLDSTMALLACVRCCQLLEKDTSFILAVTMPGMGTGKRTRSNARKLAAYLGAEVREISIKHAVLHHFDDIRHDPEKTDVVYENAQARERTQILMDLANQENGLVIGTGDLSEIALGWCTFNGDHMSMYSLNSSLPKTLIRAIVEDVASQTSGKLAKCLRDINSTPVSPELLPDAQHTEEIIGDYTLHDFFLYYFIRYGETPANLQAMAECVFAGTYTAEDIRRTLSLFMRRFFTQQFKRNTMPEGPDTGDISLSPRGGWEMPADADSTLWRI